MRSEEFGKRKLPEDMDDEKNMETSPTEKNQFCTPTPIWTGADGLPRYSEDKVVIVFLDETNTTNSVDLAALGATMAPAYNAGVNCTYTLGSQRELRDCEVVPDAVPDDEGEVFMIRCAEFISNSVDNDVFIGEDDMYGIGACECSCEDGDAFPQLVRETGYCDCPCTVTPNCACYPPYIETFLSTWNEMYQKNVTGTAAVTSSGMTIADVIEVTVLDPDDCDSGIETTFNGTVICPGNSTAAFAKWFTDSPSATPTAMPSDAPTMYPSEVPSDFPTESPTDAPTDAPTDSPTAETGGGVFDFDN